MIDLKASESPVSRAEPMEALPFAEQKKQLAFDHPTKNVADRQLLTGAEFMGQYSVRQCATPL
jgi:hypothetical protein